MWLLVTLLLVSDACAILYTRGSDNILKPDLMPVSSTVVPLPYYSVSASERKLLIGKYKKRPEGKLQLVTGVPK